MRGCLIAAILLASTARAAAQPAPFEQESFRDIAYYEGADADPVRHKLDVHVPRGQKDFPVLFFVHGGGWVKGSKNQLGIYTVLARAFNRNGIGVVCPNYRLSPGVMHPEHVRDVARAFAWTYKNIHKYGGSNAELFISGHSAGGHLTWLLATDTRYLTAEGVPPQAIKGAMPLSGLYTIPLDPFFDVAFGTDPAVHANASPLSHVRSGLPPFLVMCGDNDLSYCNRTGAEAFCKALAANGNQAEFQEIPRRNHLSILWNAVSETDPVTRSMLSFIMAQVALDRIERDGPGAIAAFGDYLARYMEVVARKPKSGLEVK